MPSIATRWETLPRRRGVAGARQALTDRSLSFLVRQAHRAFVMRLAEGLLPYGVSVAEWAVLRRLWQEEGFTQVDLAAQMRVRKASLTAVLASLARKGFLRRTKRGEDRRKHHLFLTRHGRDLEDQLLPIGIAINRRAVAGIDPGEAERIACLLERLVDNLERQSI